MTLDMDYVTIFAVMDSWEALRRLPNCEEVAGTILFNHFFERCPPAKTLFGFPADMDPGCEEMQSNKKFLRHAAYMIRMLDRALNMLGPDVELLAEILSDLGKKHARLGIKEAWFPFMGEALLETLRDCLSPSDFTPEIEHSWNVVYNGLSGAMVEAMNSELQVLTTWAKLKTIENYDIVAGKLLFQHLFRECPEAKQLFGFPVDLDVSSSTMMNSRRFQMHAKYFIDMLDKALIMVEDKKLEENMKKLGDLHVSYGVKPSYFPIMGEALFFALSETLEDDWNLDVQAAWGNVYDRLSSQMIAAMESSAAKK